jgi:hypothetical protein
MPKICYTEKKFGAVSEMLIQIANAAITSYAEQGFNLTLRQLYYYFVANDKLPPSWADPATGSVNNERSYKKLGDIIADGRLAGLVDWNAIEDRTRHERHLSHWDNPGGVISSAASSYHRDLWINQPKRVFCAVEKDALVDVIGQACEPFDVPYLSCRGYVSASMMWRWAQTLGEYGQEAVILHLGDHDPSGCDMTRDITDRLNLFCEHDGVELPEIRRIALTMAQVHDHNPPPNPTKVTDSRAAGYIEKFGHECWELDALQPQLLVALIQEHIKDVMDEEQFDEDKAVQESERRALKKAAKHWPAVEKFLKKKGEKDG